MDIANEILARKRLVPDKAEKYGFARAENGDMTYSSPLMDGELTCLITASEERQVKCIVIDSDTGDEYTPVRIDSYTGSYVGSVREELRTLITEIAHKCFSDVPFASDQANRIAALIESEYGVVPDRPFRKDNGAVFRHKGSSKWFALEMYVKENSLEDVKDADPDKYIDLMNVKIVPETLDTLLGERGIHRCFHMNKKLWITVTLDDTLTDERIMELLRTSFELTSGSSASSPKRRDSARAYWIIPSNPANYDVAKGFRDSGNDTIPWHHRINVLPGDIVYIYQTEPVAAIIYRCEVVDSFLPRPKSWSGMAPSSKYRMDIHRTDTYDKSKYPRSFLNEHGIKKTVRGQRSAPPELVKIIERQVKI